MYGISRKKTAYALRLADHFFWAFHIVILLNESPIISDNFQTMLNFMGFLLLKLFKSENSKLLFGLPTLRYTINIEILLNQTKF